MEIVQMEMATGARCGDRLSLGFDGRLVCTPADGESVCQASRDLERGELVRFDPKTGTMTR